MAFTFNLTLLTTMFVASGISLTAAEDTAMINAVAPSDVECFGSDNKVRRLRGHQKPNDEDRVAVAGPAWYVTHVMKRRSSSKLSTRNPRKSSTRRRTTRRFLSGRSFS
ncbi:hypothetical protein PI124_g11528 [Phytophthora idaei]|nr:hypothetical protein PI125_g11012 [Phytophthora idaei]KAG3154561.1 hypothetical protein PI126_g9553 [Phytophthora idaei]KAG3243676.1 hypothetical protein PI124_g11528 [Phytophthora idaei]